MKFEVSWFGEPVASQVILEEPELAGYHTWELPTGWSVLAFEDGDRADGLGLAYAIQRKLARNYRLLPWIRVDGLIDKESVSFYLMRRVAHLERAMREATGALRHTRTWLKDRRIAQIRLALEQALDDKSASL